MRPAILYDLSRYLAIVLEDGIRGESGENRIPVFLCHPLEMREPEGATEAEKAAGVLYLYRVSPASPFRQAGAFLESSGVPGGESRLRKPDVWLRLRYAFLVVGGTLEDEMGVLAAALRCVHDHPYVSLDEIHEEADERGPLPDIDTFPLVLVDAPDAWRELGLAEHRLSISFEVSVPLPASDLEVARPILQRDVLLERARTRDDAEES